MKKTHLSHAQLRELHRELTREHARPDGTGDRQYAVGEALRRIADRSYGRCLTCGAGIPFERLLVMPETIYCVTCARSTAPATVKAIA
jgi:RNA polymerase-binding transcription factor DksA